MPSLLIKNGTFEKEYRFSDAPIISIGRDPRNDVVLPDASLKVSRQHAAVVRIPSENRYFIRDLSSARSTKIEGQAVCQRLLRDQDTLEIADYTLVYFERPPQASRVRRLRVAPHKTAPENRLDTTKVFTRAGGQAITAEHEEMVEELLLRTRRSLTLTELVEALMPVIVRVMGASRGFVGLFEGEGADYLDLGGTGLAPEDQIEISDEMSLDRLRSGDYVHDQTTLLVPLTHRAATVGFLCIDRLPPAKPFAAEDAKFLATIGKMTSANLRISEPPSDASDQSREVFAWPPGIVGKSKPMEELFREIREAGAGDLNILIEGESGSGKELVARSVHMQSSHAKGPFIARNCAAIPESLAETEIFGYAPRSGIAGADPQGAPGWFEMANGGTLFLDEIQALTSGVQDKLLRVLQDQEVWKIGARAPLRVDVKVISATDLDLKAAVERGVFRKALYYRFGRHLNVPPLRERADDIPLLVHYYLDKFGAERGVKTRFISRRALHRLICYQWPGNVRELENCLASAVGELKETLFSWDFPQYILEAGEADKSRPEKSPAAIRTIEEIEKDKMMEALEATFGNITKSAELLGYRSRQTMLNKMDAYGIPRNYGDVKTLG